MSDKKFKIWILTLFPEYFEILTKYGVAGSALKGERGINFELKLVNIGEYSKKSWKGVDDAPYGGGAGMVMRADVLKNAIVEGVVRPGQYGDDFGEKLKVIFPGPRGKTWDNQVAREFAATNFEETSKDLVFICGRYEGIDERFIEQYVDEEFSLGDYILTGGELAVMVMLDSSLRFVSGVLGNKLSAETESFNGELLEHPQYTRPQDFEGLIVPEVLTSGHHKNIEKYREEERLRITKKYRPDLLRRK